LGRTDLKLIYYSPFDMSVIGTDTYIRHLDRADYAIVGQSNNTPDPSAKEWLSSRGELALTVAQPTGYTAFVIRRKR
jgi:hypothetical protein